MDCVAIEAIHESAIALSFVGLFARGLGFFARGLGASAVAGRVAKSLPHLVDTLLKHEERGALVRLPGLTPGR